MMRNWLGSTLLILVLGVPALSGAAQPPIPDNPQRAQLPLGYNFRKRCPELQPVEAVYGAVVVFWLSHTGSPSQIAIRTSSGSADLDAAALACVAKLQFPPAVTLGDATPIDSWQQFRLTWADQNTTVAPRAPAAAIPADPGAAVPPRARSDARPDTPAAGSTTVRVCVDESGHLKQDPTIVRSSGRPALDQAALKIAAAGAPYYRPEGAATGSGCAQLAIGFDAK